jgi:hypothetical protein
MEADGIIPAKAGGITVDLGSLPTPAEALVATPNAALGPNNGVDGAVCERADKVGVGGGVGGRDPDDSTAEIDPVATGLNVVSFVVAPRVLEVIPAPTLVLALLAGEEVEDDGALEIPPLGSAEVISK